MSMNKIATIVLSALVILATTACKSQEKNAEVINKVEKPEEYTSKQLYLVVRVSRSKNSDSLQVLTTEKEIIEKSGNPLPFPTEDDATEIFRCQILDRSDKVLFSANKKTNFIYGDDDDQAIVKFIVPLPEGAVSTTISYLKPDGNWEQLVIEKI